MKRNDTLWKGILENIFSDFICFFFKDADKIFDLDRGFEFLDKELEQLFPTEDIKAPKFVDKLVKVFTSSGAEEWVLVHIEVQGYDDKDFARRMYTYFYRILDKYERPVKAIAIFTDGNEGFYPQKFEYNYLGTKATFEFNTYKILEQDEEALVNNSNPFSIVVLTVLLALKKKKLDDDGLLNLKYSLARNLFGKNFPRKKVDDLLIFLQRYVTFANPEYNLKFEKEIEELTGKQKTMGIRELVLDQVKKEGIRLGEEKGELKGELKGIDKAKTEVVNNLLATNKFSVEEIAKLANVSESFVTNVKNS